MENNLFAIGFHENSAELNNEDPLIHAALTQAKSLDHRADLFTRLSLYEQRLNRTLKEAKAELKQLQKERQHAEQQSLKTAAKIYNLKQELNQEWQPDENGFEFSTQDLILWMDRKELEEEANTFHYLGRRDQEDDAE